ncbi:MAG: mechanosensitive ion channel family protein [Anaerolineae bacterium]
MEFTQTYLETLLAQMIQFIPRLIFAIIIFLLALFLANLVARVVKRGLQFRKVDPELTLLLVRISRWSAIILGLVIALQQVNFNLSSFVAGLGIVGFTLGFAFQDIAKNFIAGVLLLLQQPFDIGNSIEVGGYGGTVTAIEIRSTTLRTWDGKHVIIPNAEVYTNTITNYSRSPRRRLELEVGVAYDSDLEQVSALVRQAVQDIEGVIQDDPAPQVVFNTFADSSINLTLYYWVDTAAASLWRTQDRAVKQIKLAFEQAGVDIPFPVTTVLLEKGSA